MNIEKMRHQLARSRANNQSGPLSSEFSMDELVAASMRASVWPGIVPHPLVAASWIPPSPLRGMTADDVVRIAERELCER